MEVRSDTLYAELAKWERHAVGHSLGYLNLSRERLWFVPHARSILACGFDIPLGGVASVERSDNWLWRGAVNIRLQEPLKLDVEFLVDPDAWIPGMEESVFHSDTLRLFLGFSRKKFLNMAAKLGMPMENTRPECPGPATRVAAMILRRGLAMLLDSAAKSSGTLATR